MRQKNLRLLGREEAPYRQPSIQEILGQLKEEIALGEEVYTADELRILERKLEDYQQLLENLLAH